MKKHQAQAKGEALKKQYISTLYKHHAVLALHQLLFKAKAAFLNVEGMQLKRSFVLAFDSMPVVK